MLFKRLIYLSYIYWNINEPISGGYIFNDQNDIISFYKMAQKICFVIILRPGPYVDSEHDYGGLPWWLLSNGTQTIRQRSSETTYFNFVTRWYKMLLPKIVPLLYKNGGPIIYIKVRYNLNIV